MTAWTLVALFWVCYLLNHADRQIVPVLFPALQREFGFSSATLGLLHAVFLWTYGLCSPLAGIIGDRFSKTRLAAGSVATWSGITVLAGLAPSGILLLVTRGLLGAAECIFYPSAATLLGNAHGPATRSRAMGVFLSGQIFGVALGGTLASQIAEVYSWRASFWILGTFGLLYAVPLWLFLRRLPDSRTQRAGPLWAGIGTLLRIPSFQCVIAFIGIGNFSLFLVYSWLPTLLADRFHFGLARAGFESSVYPQIGSFAGMLLGGWLADRFQVYSKASRFWVVVAGFLLSAPAIYGIAYAPNIEIMRAAAIAFGLFNGFISANQVPCAFDVVPAGLRASAVGTYNLAGGVVAGLAPYFGGLSRDRLGLDGLLAATAVALLVGAVFPFLAATTFRSRGAASEVPSSA
jgi:MFS transporter, Spinster family, sphingosine-1-phosphate transporter